MSTEDAPPQRRELQSLLAAHRLGMRHELEFDHPRVPEGHPVRPHVLYRAP